MCECDCGQPTTWKNWRDGYSQFLKGHWRRGKTKHTNESVARAAAMIKAQFESGRTSWSSGLTKETDARIAAKAEATSRGMKAAYSEGTLTSWSKGKTRKTNESLQHTGDKLKELYAAGMKKAWYQGQTRETCPKLNASCIKRQLTTDEVIKRINMSGYTLISSLDGYKNVHSRVDVTCDKCGDLIQGEKVHKFFAPAMPCPSCSPVGSSRGEREVADFIANELKLQIIKNDTVTIHPHELDVYVPSKKFAVEYNGLYWHSSIHKTKNSHNHKTKKCMNRGIRLLHIFSDEWSSRQEIVKSIIRAKLNVGMTRLSARKCIIKDVPLLERRKFFNDNHLDGDAGAKFALGLYHDDKLVQCMSFRVPHQQKYRQMQLLENARTCPKLNTYIRGGLSRLSRAGLTKARSLGYRGLMTYVDERLGGDRAYGQAGWQFIDRTQSFNFWWTDYVTRLGRLQVRADKARGMSERDVAEERGVVRIYGCKNAIYTMT